MAPLTSSILALLAFSGFTLSLPTPRTEVGIQAATDGKLVLYDVTERLANDNHI